MQEQTTEEQLDLKAVYEILAAKPLLQSKKKTLLLNRFANLIGQKSSFAHKTHKQFNTFLAA